MKFRSLFETDLGLVQKNARSLQRIAGSGFFCPMLKAEAYGHGAGPVAKALHSIGIPQAGVISLEEAQAVKKSAPDMEILIFGPLLNKSDMSQAVQERHIPVCGDWEDLAILAELKKPAQIHLKFDTGFSRLGFPLNMAEKVADFLKDRPYILLKGLATQILSSEELSDKKSPSFHQLKLFSKLKKIFPKTPLHALNTAGLTVFRKTAGLPRFGARPGIGLYGINPGISQSKAQEGNFAKPELLPLAVSQAPNRKQESGFAKPKLSPVSCLKSFVVSVRRLKKGDRVSYGGLWRAKKASCIATLSLGYGDGFLRGHNSVKELLFRGQRRAILGAICMDFMMLNVTDDAKHRPVKIGEEAVLFGRQNKGFLSPEEQAKNCGATVYELFSQWGPRVHRAYVENPS